MPFEFHIYYKLINDYSQTDMNANPIEPGYFSAFPAGFRELLVLLYRVGMQNDAQEME